MLWNGMVKNMKEYTYVTLRQKPELKEAAAAWFHDKWEVPQEAYLECMKAYINNETEYGWYLCLDSGRIAGGLGVIEMIFMTGKTLRQMYVRYIQKRNIVVKESRDNYLILL